MCPAPLCCLHLQDYAVAHLKLSELGVEWEEPGPVTI